MPKTPNKTPFWDDVQIGQEIPGVVKPLTPPVMMRWCAAAEIYRRDHYDYKFATGHGLPDIIGSGSWTQACLYQMLNDWVGLDGWVLKVAHRNRAMMLPRETLTGWGKVTNKYEKNGLGYVELEMGMNKQDGTDSVPSSGVVVLPIKGGRPVPYPFKP